jgi:putative acyl-CoA dehydrogenase
VNALDVLRAIEREPESLDTLLAEIDLAAGADSRLDAAIADLRGQLADPVDVELRARRLVERLAICLQGSLLVRHADAAVAGAFCASRLAGDGGRAYGTLPPGLPFIRIIERHRPRL